MTDAAVRPEGRTPEHQALVERARATGLDRAWGYDDDPELLESVERLRQAGERLYRHPMTADEALLLWGQWESFIDLVTGSDLGRCP